MMETFLVIHRNYVVGSFVTSLSFILFRVARWNLDTFIISQLLRLPVNFSEIDWGNSFDLNRKGTGEATLRVSTLIVQSIRWIYRTIFIWIIYIFRDASVFLVNPNCTCSFIETQFEPLMINYFLYEAFYLRSQRISFAIFNEHRFFSPWHCTITRFSRSSEVSLVEL